ncbi:MAG TPA: adenosylcobalamin-dependent ribonucleoside-diphosphate reductase [Gammaproteobacteria bacterium]|jgi:ribonucleoside-diphosphate reductase alpha chain|nr:adenosylcobalamin-dependent ribonucleoside-diphosphate reductase [Gammaproteobacteria bacterium]
MTFTQKISRAVWEMKYRYKTDGVEMDASIEDTWRRVAHAVAEAEKPDERKHWEDKFYKILENFHFLPGGRILAGAGTSHTVTLFNCFVMNIAEDSMTGIFDALREGALTLQQGGGVGYDFSVLRPAGEMAKRTGMPASGPVSFMQIWDTTCGVLLSTGARRGAMMGVLSCDHPDIEAFIEAKSDAKLLRHFNVSVMVSDAFMQAVKNDADWQLVFQGKVYRTVKARALWQKIIKYAYDFAEPGVLFGDTINRMNNLWYCERITATNPCGEIPLPPYGACDLGAVNLTQFVLSPFAPQAQINWRLLDETVRTAARFLDNVIDVSKYPLLAQEETAYKTRRIGLGLTGLADALVMLGKCYGSEDSVVFAREVMQRIARVTWLTSIEIAKEKGSFPLFEKEYLQGEFVKNLDEDIKMKLAKHGVRNSHHNTIAPAGTISLLANNISNGIEPIFQSSYHRKVKMADDSVQTFCVEDYAFHLWRQTHTDSMPPAWVDTSSLTPQEHLAVQGAMQPFIDNAISKTINLPADFPFEKLSDVYTQAYEMGLKGCTIFRPNPVTGSVLESDKAEKPDDGHCCNY